MVADTPDADAEDVEDPEVTGDDQDDAVNLVDELTEIRGVGPATAEEIIEVLETTPAGVAIEDTTGDLEVDDQELATLLDEALDHLEEGEFGDVLAERGAEYVHEARELLE